MKRPVESLSLAAARRLVDLKAERARGALRVVRAHCEPGAEEHGVAGPLRDEIRALAGWLGLDRVVVSRASDLTRLLR